MSSTYDSSLQARLEEYIQQVGSQSEAARRVGVSVATISTYRSSQYKGNVHNVEDKLREVFGLAEDAQTLYSAPDYVPTSISQGVYATIRLAHLKGGLADEVGDAGIGKTKAALKYAQDYPNQAVYMAVNPCTSTLTAFFKYLCRVLKIDAARKDDMWMSVADRLRGGKKVLIIDEAQHLPPKTIEAIRALADDNPELGICLVGNIETVNAVRGKPAYAQIRNRTKLVNIRHTGEVQDSDVELLFPPLAGKKKEIGLLLAIARSDQGVRGACNLYSNAVDNEDTSYNGMLAMAKAMKIVY